MVATKQTKKAAEKALKESKEIFNEVPIKEDSIPMETMPKPIKEDSIPMETIPTKEDPIMEKLTMPIKEEPLTVFEKAIKEQPPLTMYKNGEPYTPSYEEMKVYEEIGEFGNIDTKNKDGQTMLMEAIRSGNLKRVETLIQMGADLDVRNKEGQTALMLAIKAGDLQMLDMLVRNGADLDIKNKEGQTALMEAIRSGNSRMVETLISRGADLDVRNKDGQTALMEAVRTGNAKMVQFLLENGASADIKDKSGRTADDYTASPALKEMLRHEKEFPEIKKPNLLKLLRDPAQMTKIGIRSNQPQWWKEEQKKVDPAVILKQLKGKEK